MKIGYARVSTESQNITSQIDLLEREGCERIYKDFASGVRDNRPGLNQMLEVLRKGDIVIIYKSDRIFRSLKNMVQLIEKYNYAQHLYENKNTPIDKACEIAGLSKTTFYRIDKNIK